MFKKNIKKPSAIVFILISAVIFGGCLNSVPASNSNVSGDSSEVLVIGSADNDSKKIGIKNETNSAIIGLSAWPVGAEFPSRSILNHGEIINTGSQADWNIENYNDGDLYYIQVTLQDGNNFVLRDIDIQQISSNEPALIKFDNGIGYLIYKGKNGTEFNTYDDQLSKNDQPLIENEDDQAIIGIPSDE